MPIMTTRERYSEIIAEAIPDRADDDDLRLGITGSRELLTERQEYHLGLLIHTAMRMTTGTREFHHGCATGADETGHQYAMTVPGIQIHGHPGHGNNNRSPWQMVIRVDDFALLHGTRPYKVRNHDIVQTIHLLIACPQYAETNPLSARSGTWQTVRLARRAHKPIIIVTSYGQVIHDKQEGQ